MSKTSFLSQAQIELEEALEKLVSPKLTTAYAPLFSSARYSLLAPAKRLRPLLLIASASTFTVPLSQAILPACAIEIIHTYSLIHDDLPCVDNDDIRRGKPSLHKAYPEWQALITGDYLLTYAFEILSSLSFYSPEQKLNLVQLFAKRSGADGLIGGQIIDLLTEGKNISWSTLQQMHYGKTAALISAALEAGGILGNVSDRDMQHLYNCGQKIGLGFQIVDDLLDTEEENKTTAVTLLGKIQAKQLTESLLKEALEQIDQLTCPAPLIQELLHKMIYRCI
ncbi:MAG: polyprenyl synthetase family protein [Chlamydiales bacterium]|jgi:geranylgeranyl pyrophosphate synthase|nr:polyprenyl synthetase family protein [Chlamydiales bacterium]